MSYLRLFKPQVHQTIILNRRSFSLVANLAKRDLEGYLFGFIRPRYTRIDEAEGLYGTSQNVQFSYLRLGVGLVQDVLERRQPWTKPLTSLSRRMSVRIILSPFYKGFIPLRKPLAGQCYLLMKPNWYAEITL